MPGWCMPVTPVLGRETETTGPGIYCSLRLPEVNMLIQQETLMITEEQHLIGPSGLHTCTYLNMHACLHVCAKHLKTQTKKWAGGGENEFLKMDGTPVELCRLLLQEEQLKRLGSWPHSGSSRWLNSRPGSTRAPQPFLEHFR